MAVKKYEKNTSDFNVVNEAIVSYVRNTSNSSLFKFNKEKITFPSFFENKMLIIQTIRKGLPYKLFNIIKNISPFTEDDWATYLNISKKSLQRYSNDTSYLFKPIHTEKIIELAEVTSFGKEVFDSTQQFYLWLNTPSYALSNLKPAELLKDSYGKELVMAELNRIEHGVFS
ncbi:MAG: type II toxin-antitoxin system Xre/ParS family antitoxin [Polaribacter sp.]